MASEKFMAGIRTLEPLALLNFLFDFYKKAPEGVQQGIAAKLPMFLGLSLEDERRWARLEAKLDPAILKIILQFIGKENMEDYERNHFRYVVTGIPNDPAGSVSDTKDTTKTSTTGDRAKDFLDKLAGRIGKDGEKQVKKELYLTGTLADPFSQKIIEKWREGVTWFWDTVLKPLGVNDLAGIEAKLATLNTSATKGIGQLSGVVRAITNEAIAKPKNKGFFGEFGWFLGRK